MEDQEQGSAFPKKETGSGKLSCERMQQAAASRAAQYYAGGRGQPAPLALSAPLPATHSHNFSAYRPASCNNTLTSLSPAARMNPSLLPHMIETFTSNLLDQYQANYTSSILIPNPNPNSVTSPNPSPNFSPSLARSRNVLSTAGDYDANRTNYDEISSSGRFRRSTDQSPSAAAASSPANPRYTSGYTGNPRSLAERSTALLGSVQQLIKGHHHSQELRVQDDDHKLGLMHSSDEVSISGGFELLAAHAYSPWFSEPITTTWPADESQYAMEQAPDDVGSHQPSISRQIDNDRPLRYSIGSAPASGQNRPRPPSASVSPSFHADGPPASANSSSPSGSSASELQHPSAADDSTSCLITPVPPPTDSLHQQGGDADAPQAEVPTDNQPPLKKQRMQRRKGAQKSRVREARVALLTKSDVEHLEDGYRWRKYGQKAVKNSPHPRSYYRCTNSKCFVKKRVERCSQDPSLVVTTYEGQHTHHSPALLRGCSSSTGSNYIHLDIINNNPADIKYSSALNNATFVPWQSSLMHLQSPGFHHVSSSLANLPHSQQLATHPLNANISPNNMQPALHYNPFGGNNSASFPSTILHPWSTNPPTSTGQHATYNTDRMQPIHTENIHNFNMQALTAAHADDDDDDENHHHQQQQVSSSVQARRPPAVLSATLHMSSTPLIVDRGLLHDMLPAHPIHHNQYPSPPS